MRTTSFVLAVVLVVLAGVGVVVWQGWQSTPTAGAPGQEGWVSTQSGPLGPADRDLIVKVRLAGLWEHPVGQEAAERATQPRVREIAGLISAEHQELDRRSIEVARQLGVLLPNQPTQQQQAWMSEISAASGSNYDTVMVNRLRQAHGTVLPLLATVRAGTRNDQVRRFAEEAAVFVQRHINYLESTGLVDFAALPEPATPTRAVVTRSGTYENVPVALIAIGVFLVCAVLIALLVRLLGRRRARREATATATSHVRRRRAAPPEKDLE